MVAQVLQRHSPSFGPNIAARDVGFAALAAGCSSFRGEGRIWFCDSGFDDGDGTVASGTITGAGDAFVGVPISLARPGVEFDCDNALRIGVPGESMSDRAKPFTPEDSNTFRMTSRSIGSQT